MSDVYRDPAKQPADPKFEPRWLDKADWDHGRMNLAGPGGTSINTENNEKGILEAELQEKVNSLRTAELQADESHKWTI